MIHRKLTKKIELLSKDYPVIAILGPRQSGKTTLSQHIFKSHEYISLEDLDNQREAMEDPRGFLQDYQDAKGVIIDEIQNVPELLSYIQTNVDKYKKTGHFIITGSQNFLLSEVISQTLAGRVAIFTLLPFSVDEISSTFLKNKSIDDILIKGFYPSVYLLKSSSYSHWYDFYIKTYLEKDVRLIKNVHNLSQFQLFIKMCAGRTGQLLNLTSLSNDCGITVNTVKEWLSLLEQSYIIFLLRPHYKNFSKRLVKSPKLYFYDSGLACSLLGIKSKEQLKTHYLKGGLFEGFVISEIRKHFYNNAETPDVYFWRDSRGNEIDCIIEKENKLIPIEIKSGKTINTDYFKGLENWNKISKTNSKDNILIYTGEKEQTRERGKVINFLSIHKKLGIE